MLKKVFIFMLMFIFVFTSFSYAKKKYYKKRTVYSSWAKQSQVLEGVITFPGPDLSVHYEHRINSTQAWAINGKINLWSSGDYSSLGLGAGLEYNFYLQGHAINGWFLGPGIGATFNTASSSGGDSSSSLFVHVGGQVGYRWIFAGGLSVSPKIMLNYTIGSIDVGGVGIGIGGLGVTAGCGIGFVWY